MLIETHKAATPIEEYAKRFPDWEGGWAAGRLGPTRAQEGVLSNGNLGPQMQTAAVRGWGSPAQWG